MSLMSFSLLRERFLCVAPLESYCLSIHIFSNIELLFTIQAKQLNTTQANRAWFFLQLFMFMWLSLETIFFICLSITLAFDCCRHTENTDLQYVLKVDAFGFLSSSLDSCDSFFK